MKLKLDVKREREREREAALVIQKFYNAISFY